MQQNTLENLVVFVPAVWIFALTVSAVWGAVLGIVFVMGRAWYAHAYIADPATRGPGALLSIGTNGALVVGGLVGCVVAAL